MRSFTLAVNGETGSVYKGLAITPFSSGNRLYAANFGLRRIDVFDGAYQPILSGAFAGPVAGGMNKPSSIAPNARCKRRAAGRCASRSTRAPWAAGKLMPSIYRA